MPGLGTSIRSRRRDHRPVGPRQCRLHPHHGLQHGGEPSGRLPLRHGGARAGREDHPCRPALHPHLGHGRPSTSPLRAGTDIVFLGGLINYVLEHGQVLQGVRRRLHQRRHAHQRRLPGHRGPRRRLLRLRAETSASTTSAPGPTRATGRRRRWRPAATSGDELLAARRGARRRSGRRQRDPTLQDPRCVFQILQAPLRALHARVGRAGLRHAEGRFLAGRRGDQRRTPGRERTPPSATPSAGRSTRPACR